MHTQSTLIYKKKKSNMELSCGNELIYTVFYYTIYVYIKTVSMLNIQKLSLMGNWI